ncbi:hypothetical protein PCE1_002358 [Barthelona sp. PCE]
MSQDIDIIELAMAFKERQFNISAFDHVYQHISIIFMHNASDLSTAIPLICVIKGPYLFMFDLKFSSTSPISSISELESFNGDIKTILDDRCALKNVCTLPDMVLMNPPPKKDRPPGLDPKMCFTLRTEYPGKMIISLHKKPDLQHLVKQAKSAALTDLYLQERSPITKKLRQPIDWRLFLKDDQHITLYLQRLHAEEEEHLVELEIQREENEKKKLESTIHQVKRQRVLKEWKDPYPHGSFEYDGTEWNWYGRRAQISTKIDGKSVTFIFDGEKIKTAGPLTAFFNAEHGRFIWMFHNTKVVDINIGLKKFEILDQTRRLRQLNVELELLKHAEAAEDAKMTESDEEKEANDFEEIYNAEPVKCEAIVPALKSKDIARLLCAKPPARMKSITKSEAFDIEAQTTMDRLIKKETFVSDIDSDTFFESSDFLDTSSDEYIDAQYTIFDLEEQINEQNKERMYPITSLVLFKEVVVNRQSEAYGMLDIVSFDQRQKCFTVKGIDYYIEGEVSPLAIIIACTFKKAQVMGEQLQSRHRSKRLTKK